MVADMSSVRESIEFFRRFVNHPDQIGAIAPSSRHLARALLRPLSQRRSPVNILEIGAGTGAVTRHIAPLLGPEDRLDICEADKILADGLKRDLLDTGPLQEHSRAGRVRLFDRVIQDVNDLLEYDFIISGLPLTAFSLRDTRAILELVKKKAKPGCVFSYFEYIGIRGLMGLLRTGEKGKRFRYLSAYLTRQIQSYQVDRQSVMLNFPPAHARHLRFNKIAAA